MRPQPWWPSTARPPTDLDDQLADGLERARGAIDSGAGQTILQTWVEATQR